MKILVTGGTGFIGKPLVRALVANGHTVTVFGREDDIDRPDSVKMVTGDITDKRALRRAFSSIDVVYHLAASMNEDDTRMWETNVTGTERVVELCKEKKVKQLVFVSSAGVLGESTKPIKEHALHKPLTKFDKSKSAAEQFVKDVPYTIIRAPPVIGSNVHWSKIFSAIKEGHPMIGSGKTSFHLVHVDDVVRMLVTVLNNKKALNQVFHVAAKDVMTYGEVYDIICKHLKVSGKKQMPQVAKALSTVYWYKTALQAKPTAPHMSKYHIHLATHSCALSTQKAKKLLGYEAYYTTPAAINLAIKDVKA